MCTGGSGAGEGSIPFSADVLLQEDSRSEIDLLCGIYSVHEALSLSLPSKLAG